MRRSLSLCFALALLASPASALILVDNFEEGDFSYTAQNAPLGTPTVFEEVGGFSTSNVIGGVRYVSVHEGGAVAIASAALTTTPADDGVVVNYAGDGQGDYTFVYDGVDDDAISLAAGSALGLDLTGKDFIHVDVTAGLLLGANLQIKLWSSTLSQQSSLVPLVDGDNAIALTSFPTLNLADIQAIQVQISGFDVGETVTLNQIYITPEPGTALLLSAGLIGLSVRRRARSLAA